MSGGPSAPYDLIVVGAGAAGSTAASEARGQGARVAMVEQWRVGGTCLNAGCDPTKALVRAAHALHETQTASRFGIEIEDAQADWPRVIDRVERVIDTIRGGDGDRNIREAGIDLRKGHARLLSPTEVAVTVLGRNPRLLPLEEPELADTLRELLTQEGVRIETGVTLECVSATDN